MNIQNVYTYTFQQATYLKIHVLIHLCIYIYASPPLQGLPFKIKSCFQRKVCISDFVRWYSYISNDFLNRFQCNVCVSTMCFAMAVKQYCMLIPLSNVSTIIDSVVEKSSLYLNMLWMSFSSGKLLNKKNKSSVSILRFCFLVAKM